jgi:hypothetical protein
MPMYRQSRPIAQTARVMGREGERCAPRNRVGRESSAYSSTDRPGRAFLATTRRAISSMPA